MAIRGEAPRRSSRHRGYNLLMSILARSSALAGAGVFAPPRIAARPRVEELFARCEEEVWGRTHRFFGWLLVMQWAFCLFIAGVWSPHSWQGSHATSHPHLPAAMFLGALLTLPALALIRRFPNAWAHPAGRGGGADRLFAAQADRSFRGTGSKPISTSSVRSPSSPFIAIGGSFRPPRCWWWRTIFFAAFTFPSRSTGSPSPPSGARSNTPAGSASRMRC